MSQSATTSASQGRYRGLIFSIVFFMLLISGLLALTFYSSGVLEKNATLNNAVHWVANDTQALMKDVFDM